MLSCLLLLTAVTANGFNTVRSAVGHRLPNVRARGRVERTAKLGGSRGGVLAASWLMVATIAEVLCHGRRVPNR
jgi:hypothetical protein